MKCPHCTVTIHPAFNRFQFLLHNSYSLVANNASGEEINWQYETMICPACKRAIINLIERANANDSIRLIQPKFASRPSAPTVVPPELASDFNESCAVISDSPAASAALSRRCLQGILRMNGFPQRDLATAIDAVLKSMRLPTELAESVDAIRVIGNFAAHPLKNTNTGEIIPVEPHEADWNLDVIEGLFDFFYVAPASARSKRAALEAKVAAAGKPPLKQPNRGS